MSLGDFGPRGQRIWLSGVLGGLLGAVVYESNGLAGLVVVAVALMSISYQVGRVIEHDVMKEKKWYAGAD